MSLRMSYLFPHGQGQRTRPEGYLGVTVKVSGSYHGRHHYCYRYHHYNRQMAFPSVSLWWCYSCQLTHSGESIRCAGKRTLKRTWNEGRESLINNSPINASYISDSKTYFGWYLHNKLMTYIISCPGGQNSGLETRRANQCQGHIQSNWTWTIRTFIFYTVANCHFISLFTHTQCT